MAISSDADAALKRYYIATYEHMQYSDAAFLGSLRKTFGCGGEKAYQTVSYGAGAGQSATFATAKAVSGTLSKRARWGVAWGKHYAVGKVDNDEIRLSGSDTTSVVRLLADEIKVTLAKAGDILEADMFTDGYGTIGSIGSFTGSTITLARASDALNFDIGSTVNLAATANAATLLNSGATGTVQGVDTNTGIITFTAAVATTWAAIAIGQTIHRAGDKVDATPIKAVGLAGWLPTTAPSTSVADFTGAIRGNDSRLYGRIVSGVGKTVRDAILETATQVSAAGGKPNVAWLNYANFLKLQQEYENKTIVDSVPAYGEGGKKVAGVFYNSFKIGGPKGPISVMSSTKCPSDRIYVLTSDTFRLNVVGKELLSNTLKEGSLVMDNEATDTVEFRRLFQGQMTCDAPGWNGVATY